MSAAVFLIVSAAAILQCVTVLYLIKLANSLQRRLMAGAHGEVNVAQEPSAGSGARHDHA